jgi:triosephosphate isomerase
MRTPLVAANWKMNKTVPEALQFAASLGGACSELENGPEVLVCPPYTALAVLGPALKESGSHLGAQNAHWEASGAYTGEISVAMLRDVGVEYVIVGHSERRLHFGETDETVALRLRSVVEGGLVPVLCVGETLEERRAGRTESVVERQLGRAFEGAGSGGPGDLVVAYEPVWAIGTGVTPSVEEAAEVHAGIRAMLEGTLGEERARGVRILYGGSVSPANAREFLASPEVDGALVGGASLEVDSFFEILAAAAYASD